MSSLVCVHILQNHLDDSQACCSRSLPSWLRLGGAPSLPSLLRRYMSQVSSILSLSDSARASMGPGTHALASTLLFAAYLPPLPAQGFFVALVGATSRTASTARLRHCPCIFKIQAPNLARDSYSCTCLALKMCSNVVSCSLAAAWGRSSNRQASLQAGPTLAWTRPALVSVASSSPSFALVRSFVLFLSL